MPSSLMQNRGNKTSSRIGPVVSRKLRAAGWNISPAARKYEYDGIYVSARDNRFTVLVDLDSEARNGEAAKGIVETLSGWDRVTDVTISGAGDYWFIRGTYQS